MILRQLHVDGFGKLTDVDLHFSDNINLICGDNEAGKSTLCSFIFHMLYGMERSRGKASRFDAYVRYLPWNSGSYGGSLTFDAEGTSWFLERSFLSEHRYLRLTRLEDGTVFPNAEAILSRLLDNVSEESYRAIYMLSSQSCSDLSSLAGILRQYTQNLPGSGSYSYSATQAIKDLKRQKKDLSGQLSGASRSELCRIEEDLSALNSKLSCLSFDNALTEDSDSEEWNNESLNHESSDYEALDYEALDYETPDYETPDYETPDYETPDYDTLDREYLDKNDLDPENSAGQSAHIKKTHVFKTCFSFLVSMLFMVSGILLCIYPPFSDKATAEVLYFLPPALCFMTGLGLFCVGFRHRHRTTNSDFDTETDTTRKRSLLSSDHLLAEALALLDHKETLLRQKYELEQRLTSDTILLQKISALQIAIDTIDSLSAELYRSFNPDLQRTFTRHASLLTGRPFSQLLIDETFHFSLLEGNHIIPIEALSRGTIAQLFFACRLATIELIHPHATLPLLLDDVFSLTDEHRLSVLLSRLCLDYSGQKLIFSCQKREAMILSQLSLSYHLIQL